MAGTIGLVQNDIKRVLAYSTVSQLGYMFLAMGVGAYAAGIFHLYTHAFFKALLFLGSGAVIHALAGEQDLRNMGGLRKALPITYWTFLIGALAIAGVPPLAGLLHQGRDPLADLRAAATRAVGHRRGHVVPDRDLHVPPRVPDVPRRAPSRCARGAGAARMKKSRRAWHGTRHGHRRARTARPRARHGHGAPSPRRAAGDGARADRAGDRVDPRRLRRRAARRSAAQSHRALPRAVVRGARDRRRRRSSSR